MNWNEYKGRTLNVTLHENYGLKEDVKNDTNLYEIVFKTGKLIEVFEDSMLLETMRSEHKIIIYIPFTSIKCVEIFDF